MSSTAKLFDSVKESCNSPGSGTITLLGAASGPYRTFSSVLNDGDTTVVEIRDQSGTNWETGLHTWNSGANTISRSATNVLDGSAGAGNLTTFSSGTQDVFLTFPSKMLPTPMSSGIIPFSTTQGLFSSDQTNLIWDYNNNLLKTPICDYNGQVYNVKAYGAVGNGIIDDTTSILNTINAVKSTGGIVYLPPGTYLVSSTIKIGSTTMANTDYQSISLYGAGFTTNFGNANDSPWRAATTIKWTGSGTFPVIQVGGPATSGYLPIGGCQISNLAIDGNSTATNGIYADCMQGGMVKNVGIKSVTTECIFCTTSSSITNIDTFTNQFQNIAVNGVTGIRLDGNASGTANSCHNIFNNIFILYTTGNGIELDDCDNNSFYNIWMFRFGGSGYGINIGPKARSNYFYHIEAAGGVLSQSPQASNYCNVIFGYDKENGQPEPTIQSGAALTWTEDSRKTNNGWNLAGPLQIHGGYLSCSVGGTAFTATNTTTSSTKNTTTSLVPTGVGTMTIPANFLSAGRTIKVRAMGIATTTITSACTLTFLAKLGSTTVITSAAVAPSAAATNVYWEMEFLITCLTTGSSGTVRGQGCVWIPISATVTDSWGMPSTGTVTIDTTSAQLVDFQVTQSNNTNAQTITCTNFTMEVLN